MQVCTDEDPHRFYQTEQHFARCWLQHPGAPEVAALHQAATSAAGAADGSVEPPEART
jgi:hypothetical protein